MRKQGRTIGGLVLAVASVMAVAGASDGRRHRATHGAMVVRHANGALAPTRVAPKARGKAQLALVGDADGRFTVSVRHLAPNGPYDLIVGAAKVASLQTNGGGNANLRFTTRRHGGGHTLGFDPRGDTVVVRDDHGEDVLVGTMPTGGADPTAAACCAPDEDGEVECHLLSAADCGTAGGVAMAATACLPDPCAGGQPPKGMVCCTPPKSTDGAFIDEESEAGCRDDVSAADCAAAGGMLVDGSSCDDDTCAATPPAGAAVCCVADDGEQKCEVLTPERCAAEGGVPNAATSCSPDPCGSGQGGEGGNEN